MYNQVEDYIDLPDSSSVKNHQLSMEINTADPNDLWQIHMIGDVLATRIVKYREALGGFISEEQFDEVYALSDEALHKLNVSVYIGHGFSPRLIKINSDSLDVLKSHPYITDQLAEDIVRFREINGTIESEKVLVNFKSVDKSNFQKLIFYLDFQ